MARRATRVCDVSRLRARGESSTSNDDLLICRAGNDLVNGSAKSNNDYYVTESNGRVRACETGTDRYLRLLSDGYAYLCNVSRALILEGESRNATRATGVEEDRSATLLGLIIRGDRHYNYA